MLSHRRIASLALTAALAVVATTAHARDWNVQIATPGIYLSNQPYYQQPYQPQYQPYYQPGVRIYSPAPVYVQPYYNQGRPIVYPEPQYQFRPPHRHHHHNYNPYNR